MSATRPAVAPALARPVVRALSTTPAFAVAAASCLPMVVTVLRGGDDLAVATTAAALVGASSLGFAIDDVAANTVAAVPVPLGTRRSLRGALIGAVVAIAWLVAAAAAWTSDVALGPLGRLAPPSVATAGLALGLAGWLGQRDEPAAGAGGCVGALLAVLTSTVMSMRWPWFPSLLPGASATSWWLIAAAAWAAAAWWSRDPASRLGASRVRASGAPMTRSAR
jgi:hypothetical protein